MRFEINGRHTHPLGQPRAPELIAWLVTAALLLPTAIVGAAPPDPSEFNGFIVENASVPLEAILRGGPPRDGIPSIDRPRFVSAAQAGLADDDRLLGLVINGHARAYPVRILNWHEVVNDRFGDRAVAVTYCPLCGSGMAFDARVNRKTVSFGVSGLLYNSDVLLYDRTSSSLWSQMMLTAVSGPMKGTRLSSVPLTHTSWADWRRRHPDTRVLSTNTGYERNYARDPYAGYERIEELMFRVEHQDIRYPMKEWVLGVTIGNAAKAYPFSALAGVVDPKGDYWDSLDGQRLRIRFDKAHRTAEAFDAQGRPLNATMAFWFAWIGFFPRTEVLGLPAASGGLK